MPATDTKSAASALHESVLTTALRMSIRTSRPHTPQTMGERASCASMAWAVHRLLERLAVVDPDGVEHFTEELLDELEMGSYGDDIADTAQALGLPAQTWIDEEFAAA